MYAAFSAGTILSTALFLILFEATHYIATGYTDEAEITWYCSLALTMFLKLSDRPTPCVASWNRHWGTMVLCGILFPFALDTLVLAVNTASREACSPSKDVPVSATACETVVDPAVVKPVVEDGIDKFCAEKGGIQDVIDPAVGSRARILFGVLVGDAMHNLCDGFFIGAAFRYCGDSRAWTIASVTIVHELSQELVDYILLTGKVSLLV